jgi:predicted dehydrogenase
VAALKAGKDCHTEKPLGVTIEHDLAALKAVRKYGRIFQYGTERRSTPTARHAIELVLNGRIGKVEKIFVVSPGSETGGSAARGAVVSNRTAGRNDPAKSRRGSTRGREAD